MLLKAWMIRIPQLMLLFGILAAGCARLPQPLHIPDDFFEIGANTRIDETVSGIGPDFVEFKTFKGMGSLKIWKPDMRPYTVRMAWAVERPDRMRVELMDLMGKPVISWVGNRDIMQMLSIADGQFQETRGERLELDRLVSVPLSIGDLITILSGKVPIVPHRYRKLEETDREIRLTFYDDRLNLLETVRVDRTGQGNHYFEINSKRGKIQFEGSISGPCGKICPKGPAAVQVTDGEDSGLSLEITHFWPDAAIGEHLFHLKAPS